LIHASFASYWQHLKLTFEDPDGVKLFKPQTQKLVGKDAPPSSSVLQQRPQATN